MTHIENESQGSEARSPVIDLEAEDISPPSDTGDFEPPKEQSSKEEPLNEESLKEEQVSSPPPPAREKSPFWTKGRIAGLAAVVAAFLGAWAYREFGAYWWPPSAMSVMEEKLGTLEASNRTLNDQLVGLSKSFDTFKAATGTSLDEQAKARGDFETRLATLDNALSELRQSVAGLGSNTGGSVDASALADITRRVGELEKQVAALHEGGPTTPATGNDDFAQLAQALSDLKAKFQAGAPFKDELDRIAIYVPGNTDFADLAPYAASGIANAEALGTALEALIPSLAGPVSDGPAAAEASGFWAWVGTVVKIRDLNTLDWTDLAKSAAAQAKAGDLKGAIARIEEPGGELPSALADWRDKARQRLKADGAMAQLAAAVTQIIMGKP